MAGLGRKVFTAGDVLTASDVQNYLMDQTVMNFAGTAARSSAIATPTDGMVTYNQSNDQIEAYNGSAWVGMSGLQLVKKQTIGTAVSSVTVTSAFSSTYDNYRILINGGVGSAVGYLSFQLGNVTTGYYSNLIYSNYAGGSVLSAGNNNGANFPYAGVQDTINLSAMIDINSPNLTKQKLITAVWYDNTNNGRSQGQCADQNAQTAFTIIPSTGTLTGGTIYVYGYGT